MKILRKSLWVYHFNSGSCNGCDLEFITCFTPKYDLERFGVKLVASPKHADVLVVTGPVTKKALPLLKEIYNQMPSPKFVIALGNCAISGGPFYKSNTVIGGVEKVIPVDIKIVGCPPRPESIIEGLLELARRI